MRKSNLALLISLVALLIVGVSVPAQGQDVANGQAIANVLASLTVVATQPLDFGNVFQGVAKTQDETNDALSGIFTISGASGAGISVFFQLPDYLALASGADRMIIAFSNQDCTFSVLDAAAPSTPSAPGLGALLNQDPRLLAGTTVGAGGVSQIFIGGKVTPAVNQSAGAYTGDIVCTVAYTGT
ncbi:MAG: hypothetical protein HY851_11600 [candidate division Zixibacteria bacterium]|nr:hypothetical protein [candidate division Zixibacteria bacterium]